MMKLGMDAGVSSCQFILIDDEEKILYRKSVLHHNKVKKTVLEILPEVAALTGNTSVSLSVCGTMSHLLGLPSEYAASEVQTLPRRQDAPDLRYR